MRTVKVRCHRCNRCLPPAKMQPHNETVEEYGRKVRQQITWVCWHCNIIGW